MSPSRIPGSGVFKNIKELRPGHYMIYEKDKIKIKRYWNIQEEKNKDTFEQAKNKIEFEKLI